MLHGRVEYRVYVAAKSQKLWLCCKLCCVSQRRSVQTDHIIKKTETPRLVRQDDDSVTVRLYFLDDSFDWYKVQVQIPKEKLIKM